MDAELLVRFDTAFDGRLNGPCIGWAPGRNLSPTTVKTVLREVWVDRFILEHDCEHLRDDLFRRVQGSEVIVNEAKWAMPVTIPRKPTRVQYISTEELQ